MTRRIACYFMVLLAMLVTAGACGSGSGSASHGSGDASTGVPPHVAGTFTEMFDWNGTHAAVVNGGQGSTVWWNSQNWDVTGDTHAIAIMAPWSNTPVPSKYGLNLTNTNSGHATYIHKAAKPCDFNSTGPCDTMTDDTSLVPGGDGSAGIGVIHLDEQDMVGARLRNPIVISESAPGIVRLRAPRFVTDGGWWEIAFTPADRVIGSENTVVQSVGLGDGLEPGMDENVPTTHGAGPGHDPQEESYNFVVTGHPDFACEDMAYEEGMLVELAVKTLFKNPPPGLTNGSQIETGYRFNATNVKDYFDGKFYGNYQKNYVRVGLDGRSAVPKSMQNSDGSENAAAVDAANQADQNNLYLWELVVRPSGVDVKADFNDGQGLVQVEHFYVGVPWPQVYVHIMGVAYQNDHHPQVQPCYVPNPYTQREMHFRTLSISPTTFTKTAVFPPDGAPTDASGNVMLCNGGSCGRWRHYDMRDTHNWGPPDVVTVNGQSKSLPKANPDVFSFTIDYAHGSTNKYTMSTATVHGGIPPEPSFDLYVPINEDVTSAKAANLVYNVLGAHGIANLSVNGTPVGPLSTADTVIGAWVKNNVQTDMGCPDYDCMSVRRSIAIDPKLLVAGAKNKLVHLQVVFDQNSLGTGTFLDRLELEVMH